MVTKIWHNLTKYLFPQFKRRLYICRVPHTTESSSCLLVVSVQHNMVGWFGRFWLAGKILAGPKGSGEDLWRSPPKEGFDRSNYHYFLSLFFWCFQRRKFFELLCWRRKNLAWFIYWEDVGLLRSNNIFCTEYFRKNVPTMKKFSTLGIIHGSRILLVVCLFIYNFDNKCRISVWISTDNLKNVVFCKKYFSKMS